MAISNGQDNGHRASVGHDPPSLQSDGLVIAYVPTSTRIGLAPPALAPGAAQDVTATSTSRSAAKVMPCPAVEIGALMSRRPSAPMMTFMKKLNAIVTVELGTPKSASELARLSKQFGCGSVAPYWISNIS